MKKYFDKLNNRLVFTGKIASPDFWDNVWDVKDLAKTIRGGIKNRLIVKTTKKYLTPDKSKKILEAGCGNGQFVHAFHSLGYDVYGVDYAAKTVSKTKSIFPELNITIGDVRNLDFPDNYFDGYWSVGVIEHFYDGYDPIINEMKRVLKPGGVLFISFPHMSILRKLKTLLGCYGTFKNIPDSEEFYQFALDHEKVIAKLNAMGFLLLKKIPYSGTKGLKDEISFTKPVLQRIFDSKNILIRIINYGLSLTLARFSSHAILLVFRKK